MRIVIDGLSGEVPHAIINFLLSLLFVQRRHFHAPLGDVNTVRDLFGAGPLRLVPIAQQGADQAAIYLVDLGPRLVDSERSSRTGWLPPVG